MEKMSIVLLGSGNMATRLGAALQRGNTCRILQVYSRNREHAEELAALLHSEWTASIEELAESDIILSCVRDSVSENLWKQLSVGKRLLLHTAGSLPLNKLAPYAENYGVLYPLMTLSKTRTLDFSGIPMLIEADCAENLERVRALAQSVSRVVYEADSEARRHVHLAAVFANNFSNHMFALAGKLLNEYDLPFDLLRPIIDETAAKLHTMTPQEAQTGPAVRYDENVMAKHLEMLDGFPLEQEIYSCISRSIHEMSLKK